MATVACFANIPEKDLLPKVSKTLSRRLVREEKVFTNNFFALSDQEIYQQDNFIFIFAGSVYNCEELKTLHSLKENPVSALLAELFLSNGAESFSEIDGSFVFIVYNKISEELWALRDPVGEKAIYYWHSAEQLILCSEIKGILEYPAVKRSVNLFSLEKYLTFSYVPGGETMISGVFELLPGHYLHFREKELKIKNYWSVFPDNYRELREKYPDFEVIEDLKKELENTLKSRLPEADTPLGAFLSGGIDSSLVCALAQKFREKPIKTYSIFFGKNYPNELYYSSMVAKHIGSDHQILELKPKNFLKKLFEIIWYLDDPIGDPITVPNFMLAEMASKEVPVIFNGEGGDPCFGGPKNIPMALSQLYGNNEQDSFENYYLRSYRKCYDILPFLFSPETQKKLKENSPGLISFIKSYDHNDTSSFLDKMMYLNIKMKGTHHILVKVEKMTSANKLEAKAPLFSPKLVRQSFLIPPKLKLNGRVEKYALKKAVEDLLPAEVVYREKKGMMVPVKYWFQKELKSYAKKVLSPKRIKEVGIFSPNYIKDLLADNLEFEHRNNTGLKIWMLITFDIWHRIFIEGEKDY